MNTTYKRALGRAIVIALAFAAGLPGCGGGSGAAPAQPPAAELPVLQAGTWAVMGSSTAAGAGAPAGKSWAVSLQTTYTNRATLINLAVGGSTTYHGLSASAAPAAGRPAADRNANVDAALARKPVLLIVSYPTNDTALGYSAEETVANLLSIRAAALAVGVPVVMLSTQPRALGAAQLAQLQVIDERLGTQAGPCFVRVRALLAGPDGHLAPGYDAGDGVHPNEAGHQLIATQIKTLLDSGSCVRLVPN